jgi:hypothetical protein
MLRICSLSTIDELTQWLAAICAMRSSFRTRSNIFERRQGRAGDATTAVSRADSVAMKPPLTRVGRLSTIDR